MKKITIIGVVLISFCTALFAQQLSFSKDIAPVFYNKCSSCHNDNGAAPFSIKSHKDIAQNLASIRYVISKEIMPPSKAKNDSMFINARSLTDIEIDNISRWIKEGAVNDKEDLKYRANAKHSFDDLGKPDLILKPLQAYKIEGNNTEQFISFIIDPKFTTSKIISAISIKPGNKKVVHHARLEFDTSGYVQTIANNSNLYNTLTVNESKVRDITKVGFYVPGLNYSKFPAKTGLTIPKDAIFVLNVHYGPSSKEEYDHSEIQLYFIDDKEKEREIENNVIFMDDKKSVLPRDSITFLTYNSAPFGKDFCITAIEPHMHLIGKSIKVDLISESKKDTVLLVNIPDWDFNWQEFYFLKKGIVAPKGAYISINAKYDNTTNNPKNPFYPPKNVDFGDMKTTNEMLGVLIQGFDSRKGDPVFDFEKEYQ